jgi:DNA-binding MarR family transcriptional regulator
MDTVPVQALPTCVCAALRQVTRAVTQIYDEALEPSGVRAMQYSILMTIRGHGEISVSGISKFLKLDQTTVTRSLQILERNQWIRQIATPDRRTRTVRLTPKGVSVVKKAEPLWQSVQARALAILGEDSWTAARAPLARLATLAAPSDVEG